MSLTSLVSCLFETMDRFRASAPEFRTLWAPLLVAIPLWAGCLSIDAVPTSTTVDGGHDHAGQDGSTQDDASPRVNCAESRQPDPLVGAWKVDECVLEFFSNGHYDDCGRFSALGFAADWSLLDDGRYYFGRSSLGSPSGECLAMATFSEDCTTVSLDITCDGSTTILSMSRQ